MTVQATGSGASDDVLLRAENVSKHFSARGGSLLGGRQVLRAVDGVSLRVRSGETLGVVGESGCGKSTLGRCLVRLTDITSGTVSFEGRDITHLSRRQLRPVRSDLQLVFQDPYASLNPRRRVGDILSEPLQIHRYGDRRARARRVEELLEVVGLNASHIDRFPHEFSGGQRQRVGIARALAVSPKVIVADEPVSALDVSIQAQVLNLFADLQDEFALTYVFIAHDLGVVRHVSSRIAVMYLGEVIETAASDPVYTRPAHPYTEALLSAAPDVVDEGTVAQSRIVLTGDVPNPVDKPSGCPFRTRCSYAQDVCAKEHPPLAEVAPGRYVACHFPLVTSTGEVAPHALSARSTAAPSTVAEQRPAGTP